MIKHPVFVTVVYVMLIIAQESLISLPESSTFLSIHALTIITYCCYSFFSFSQYNLAVFQEPFFQSHLSCLARSYTCLPLQSFSSALVALSLVSSYCPCLVIRVQSRLRRSSDSESHDWLNLMSVLVLLMPYIITHNSHSGSSKIYHISSGIAVVLVYYIHLLSLFPADHIVCIALLSCFHCFSVRCLLQDLLDNQVLLVQLVSTVLLVVLEQLVLLVALGSKGLSDLLVYQEDQATQDSKVNADKWASKVLREPLDNLVKLVALDHKDLLEIRALLVHRLVQS